MDDVSALNLEDANGMELSPGFRFHPTEKEIITRYLFPKVINNSFIARAVGEVDLNKFEPWDLPSDGLHISPSSANSFAQLLFQAIAVALAYVYGHHPKLNDCNAFRVLAATSFLDL
ncbi:hypothetical protein Cni_G19298 [Canna indica]|uniref:NAC domain-containing protein n=1 Tax=Canna indica TaxID=4628 RepID=A0AAQ3KKW1_9LILI|nr:hypothetical protein Cni_G19297 [Canna indica]WOL10540.1 hypothetical protein Cni_G19298 [Canna indica]